MSKILGRLFERNSIFVATIFAGAFAFQGFFDVAINKWWDAHNHNKLWSNVKTKFIEGGAEEDDDDE
ncbi:QCR9 [Candida oxycetoniae]|uniref:Complex III subunit 9 n=1 Tax=Candida oxycetoniae TaxID=497107 RepID=A0AAI9STV7_9ASCO|nr:QCR9 [Candida oxycetoniae]KAI3402718.1 QCR9 [Candida oxycetoniae]